jgi:hypothetical protein
VEDPQARVGFVGADPGGFELLHAPQRYFREPRQIWLTQSKIKPAVV